jgi:hypothetical protein
LPADIDLVTGQVTLGGKKERDEKSAEFTAYLLGTGPRPAKKDGKWGDVLKQIDALKASGWKPPG